MNQLSDLRQPFSLCFNFFIHNFPPQHPLLSPLCLVPSPSPTHQCDFDKCFRATIPNLFGTREQFHGRKIFHRPGWRGWFWDDSSALHLLCTLFLLFLQLHLRLSCVWSLRLGTPVLGPWQMLQKKRGWGLYFNQENIHTRRQQHPTPVLLPGKSQGQRSLEGCRLWGRTESDTTEAT